MTPASAQCSGCGKNHFPPRYRCHRCGSFAFSARPLPTGAVSAVTRVHRAPEGWRHVYLVEVEAEGVRIIAGSDFAPPLAATVALRQEPQGGIFIDSQASRRN